MRRNLVLAATIALLTVGGCRSPFGASTPPDPEANRVGRGIHGWPLYESSPHGSGWRTDVVWPAFSSIKTDGDGLNSTEFLIPIFLSENQGERRRVGVLRPLWDLETKGDEVYDLDVLWPIFKWKDTPTTAERRVFPFYFTEESDDSGLWHLWPLYGHDWNGSRDQKWVLAPLFSHTTNPERNVSTWDAPWPLIHWGTEGDTRQLRALPFLWHDEAPGEHHTVVFPFIWDMEDSDSTFRMVFPLFAEYEADDGDHATGIVPPLYISGRDGDEDYTMLLAPFVRWGATPDAWSFHLFPIVWLEREDDGDSTTHIWPLFGWERNGKKREASTIWPFVRLEWDDDSWELDLPWPLVNVGRSARESNTRIWPLFNHETRLQDFDGGYVEDAEGSLLLFLSNWESSADGNSDFRILWKLFRKSHEDGKDTFVVNPLFRHETNDEGDDYWSFLFGMIARKQEAGDVNWRFLWFL